MIQNLIEWLYDGKGQVLIGFIFFAFGCFLLVCGVLYTLSGLGFFKATKL